MSESLAIVGLVAAVIQFIDFSTKVVTRLNEFHAHINSVPESFQDVKIWLPLLLDTIKRTKEHAEAGDIDEDTQKALLPVIEGCRLQVETLNNVLIKILPASEDSSWRRCRKALSSLGRERKVQQITAKLLEYIATLTMHQVTGRYPTYPLELERNGHDDDKPASLRVDGEKHEAVEALHQRVVEQDNEILGKEYLKMVGSINELRISPQTVAGDRLCAADAGAIHNGNNVKGSNVLYGGSQIFNGGSVYFGALLAQKDMEAICN